MMSAQIINVVAADDGIEPNNEQMEFGEWKKKKKKVKLFFFRPTIDCLVFRLLNVTLSFWLKTIVNRTKNER